MDDFETIAIPLWEKTVAPRFGCADRFLIVKVSSRYVGESKEISISEGLNWNRRLSILREHSVELLICGGFNNCFLPLAERLGIKVKRGACGLVSEIVERYANGTLALPDTGCGQQNGQKQRRRFCNR